MLGWNQSGYAVTPGQTAPVQVRVWGVVMLEMRPTLVEATVLSLQEDALLHAIVVADVV
jgi:hypothetical protein